jgi:hypothetical protein
MGGDIGTRSSDSVNERKETDPQAAMNLNGTMSEF